MKINIIATILTMVLFSCQESKESKESCLNKIEYVSQKESLVPSVINVNVIVKDYDLQKKMDSDQLKRVLFYSIKNEFSDYFVFLKTIKREGGAYDIKVLTSFFDANRSFNNYKTKRQNWTQEEIEKTIKGDIGLVFENDTIVLKQCN